MDSINLKNLYTVIILTGILTEGILLVFFDKKIVAYGPVLFWAIGLFGIIHSGILIFTLSKSVKKSKPEIYKKFSFGLAITRSALSNFEFLNSLSIEEKEILKNQKLIFKYVLICFGLFVISALAAVIKSAI